MTSHAVFHCKFDNSFLTTHLSWPYINVRSQSHSTALVTDAFMSTSETAITDKQPVRVQNVNVVAEVPREAPAPPTEKTASLPSDDKSTTTISRITAPVKIIEQLYEH